MLYSGFNILYRSVIRRQTGFAARITRTLYGHSKRNMPENFHLNFQQSVKAASGVYYRVVQYLGSGGNAITYLANATSGPNKGVAFAIKVFRKLSAPERRDRFLEETKTLFDIDHPAIMRVFDSGL